VSKSPTPTERALLYLYNAAGSRGVTCFEVGDAVWPDRPAVRAGKGVSHQGGGDYAAQMLLGRLKKAGHVEHVHGQGSTTHWRLTKQGLATVRRLG
jgi:hypothetical protein